MKKILGIVALSLLLIVNAYADKGHLGDFNEFLVDNYLKLQRYGIEGVEVINVCNVYKKNSKKWLNAECNDRPGGTFEVKNKLKIKFYKGYIKKDTTSNKKVNLGTLIFRKGSYFLILLLTDCHTGSSSFLSKFFPYSNILSHITKVSSEVSPPR